MATVAKVAKAKAAKVAKAAKAKARAASTKQYTLDPNFHLRFPRKESQEENPWALPEKMPPCPRCAANPAAHNFFELGKLGETDVLYCAPAKAIESKETSESFSYFVSHLEAVQGKPWIFLVDCKGMKLRHTYSLSLTKQIMRVMNEDHEATLQKVILLNPNTWTRAFLTIIQPFLQKTFSKKLKMLQTEMDLFVELSAYGSATKLIGALRNQEILGTLQEENEEE